VFCLRHCQACKIQEYKTFLLPCKKNKKEAVAPQQLKQTLILTLSDGNGTADGAAEQS
jgi:hypothetical protein